MIGVKARGRSQSLRNQVTGLEMQLMLRRQRVRTLVAGTRQKVAARLASPSMLLAAVGVGVAVEQTSHHQGWSIAAVLDATNACIRLLLSLSPPVQQDTESARRLDP